MDTIKNKTNFPIKDRDIFANQISLPATQCYNRENAIHAACRAAYDQVGYDLTDHTKFALLGEST